MPVDFRLLGPLEVVRDGEQQPLRGAGQRTLLVDLLLNHGRVVSVDRLVDDLWPERPPAGPRRALESQASRLRQALGLTEQLIARPPGYVLEVDRRSIDSVRFEELLAEAHASFDAGEPTRAGELARSALALWRGPAVADFTYEPFAQVEIARLEELRLEALSLRIDCDLALGRSDLVAELEALVATEPLRERLRAQLMLALYRQGRQADALEAFRAARETLLEELGVEPNPELHALQTAILNQDRGLALPVSGPAVAQRKLATIFFADLADSTGLALSLDPEAYRTVLRRYFDAASGAVVRHGGTVEKFAGDAVMAVFGTPIAHEDDALRAARAALETRDAVAGLDLEVRIGLATGEVITGGGRGDPLATGPALSVAARLQQEVESGQIAVDELTHRLTVGAARFADLGELELRGLRRPVRAFRLDGLVSDAPSIPRRLDAPLVDRGSELEMLREAFAAAVNERTLTVVTVSGTAGIGKSRLARELVDAVSDDATVLVGRCQAYGENAPFRPLRDALGSPDEVASALRGEPEAAAISARLQVVFGTETSVPADEVPWAFRRYCETLAAQRPLILALDDLQWADSALLELLEHLASSARAEPILLLCLAREELAEERPRFSASSRALVLEPLSDDDAGELAGHLFPDAALESETRDALLAVAEGNPLFLEQLVAHVRETGLLEPPPTLRALLAARLDRLGPGERGVLERAAVVGRDFAAEEVAELLDEAAMPTVRAHLESLTARGFLRVRHAGLRFRHGLVHDAVYRSTSKELRAELHERHADVLARRHADDEDVGYHLERSYLLRTELAPPDRHARQLAEDAGRRLGAAGIRAWKRGEAAGASRLLERATALLPEEDERRRELLCELGIALNSTGETARADEVLSQGAAAAARVGDRRIELRARVEHAALRLLRDPREAAADLLEIGGHAVPVFESVGDDRALGRTWMLMGWVQGGLLGRHAEWEADATRALEYYRAAGWPPATCVGHIAAAAYGGPTPAAAGVARCRALLERDVADRASEANVLAHLGGLQAMLGSFAEASELLERARAGYLELGRKPQVLLTCAPIEAEKARLTADTEGAAEILLESCRALHAEHRWFHLATQAAELAGLLVTLGRDAEADEWCALSERFASEQDVSAQLWRRLSRARILLREGNPSSARRLVAEARSLSESTDSLNAQAAVHRVAAELDGPEQLEAAFDLYMQKGNVAAAALLRAE
ncbi:MAG TPA: BTAD domain-containing putative transcriptional regulator [Gaiellaceae bacterium]|nr:BTAD domain-containing putative transcriptional regulator [Gaiellaceae bacterium]